jgi:hypothetical protein
MVTVTIVGSEYEPVGIDPAVWGEFDSVENVKVSVPGTGGGVTCCADGRGIEGLPLGPDTSLPAHDALNSPQNKQTQMR